jgi:hypothetical protein
MSILVRRIARAKWGGDSLSDENEFTDVSADAITNCLKTSDNALSVWRIESEGELNDALLALITGKKQEKLSKIDYVLINENKLIDKGLSLIDSDGDTVVDDLVKKHRNIANLSYKKLGAVKDLILDCIHNGQCHLSSKQQNKTLLKESIKNGKLQKENLNEKLVNNEGL